MMGNIYAYSKNDVPTAEIFYQKVIEQEPKNYIALNNIAGIIAKSGNQEKALSYFEKVLAINPNYPNALYGISLTFYNQRRYHEAFDKVCLTLKALNKEKVKNPTLESRCQSLQLEIAKLVLEQSNEEEFFFPFLEELEQKTSKKIEVVIDDSINTAAKIEIAEYKGKTNHIIRYKKAATGYAHLVLHELTHLELIHEARQEDENFLFTATHTNENNFHKKAEKDKKRIIKGGVPEENLRPFLNSMFNGINLQMYNAPIDLFIEDRLYERYKKLRPIQFLSLLSLNKQGIAGANSPIAKKVAPRFVRDANIILSYTQLFKLKELFGTNLTREIKEPTLQSKAREIYKEYEEMKKDKEGGEEYDLIKWWAEDLKLTPFFTLVKEEQATPPKADSSKQRTPEEVMLAIEEDPYNLSGDTTFEDEQMRLFVESNKGTDTNLALVMYMVDALKNYKTKSKAKIKEVGIEIAELGRHGIDPGKKATYRLSTVPNTVFSGWKLLAYMYVAWSIFEPSMVPQFQLNFEKEYEMAKALSNQ